MNEDSVTWRCPACGSAVTYPWPDERQRSEETWLFCQRIGETDSDCNPKRLCGYRMYRANMLTWSAAINVAAESVLPVGEDTE